MLAFPVGVWRDLTLIDSSLITYDVDCLFKGFPVISLSSGWCLFRLFVHLLSRIVIFGFLRVLYIFWAKPSIGYAFYKCFLPFDCSFFTKFLNFSKWNLELSLTVITPSPQSSMYCFVFVFFFLILLFKPFMFQGAHPKWDTYLFHSLPAKAQGS